MTKLDKAKTKRRRKAARGPGFTRFDPTAHLSRKLRLCADSLARDCPVGRMARETARLLDQGLEDPEGAEKVLETVLAARELAKEGK